MKGSGKVILDPHLESTPKLNHPLPMPTMFRPHPSTRYLAYRQTDTDSQTDRHAGWSQSQSPTGVHVTIKLFYCNKQQHKVHMIWLMYKWKTNNLEVVGQVHARVTQTGHIKIISISLGLGYKHKPRLTRSHQPTTVSWIKVSRHTGCQSRLFCFQFH